ncbi:esterase/lipase [Sphingopyxis fribergensis]|uniref:Esterase/lipase n=1 Tax=Sphingopyxis fribergensis TaxID=1515612 RepID=A0A0A7PGQ7_9SPHN|nr:esterase/lipase [Sphingopyxis fribergensis]
MATAKSDEKAVPSKEEERTSRPIAPPPHLSEMAQQLLSTPPAARPPFPATDDPESWIPYIESMNDRFRNFMNPRLRERMQRVRTTSLGGPLCYIAEPEQNVIAGKVCLSLHGGALMLQGGDLVAYDVLKTASQSGCLTFSVDYRMPPHDPYPAGLDDCLAAYVHLLESWRAQDIIVIGISAGGNLAASMVLRAIDEGLPAPAGLVLRSPEVDLTESGDTFHTNFGIDNVLPVKLMPINRVYAGGQPLDHPYISPLFGGFTSAFPPTFVQSGTRDLFLSNSVRIHRKLRDAGVDAELHVWEAMPHAGFGGLSPEDEEVWAEIRRFMARCFGKSNGQAPRARKPR